MLSEMCLESTARACGGSWPLTYSQHLFCLLDVCISTLFELEVAHNVMRHISLLKSRHLSADMPQGLMVAQKLTIFVKSNTIEAVNVLKTLLANINYHVLGWYVHSLMVISPLLITYWNLGIYCSFTK